MGPGVCNDRGLLRYLVAYAKLFIKMSPKRPMPTVDEKVGQCADVGSFFFRRAF